MPLSLVSNLMRRFFKFWTKETPYLLGVLIVILLLVAVWMWQYKIIPAEKGLYSPFQNSLSLIKYIGLICGLNLAMTISASRRNVIWIYLPLIVTIIILILTVYYFFRVIAL